MSIRYITLYVGGVPVQVVEGGSLHLIFAGLGATTVPGVPLPGARPDPFPYYVNEDELAAAGIGTSDASVAALVGDDASATSVALRAAFVPATVISGAGVDPTGATDSTTAIQAFLAAGGHLHLGEGTHRVTTTLTAAVDGTRISGPGKIVMDTDDRTILVVSGDNVTIDGLTFQNTGTGTEADLPNSYGAGVAFREVTGGSVTGCTFLDCGGSYGAGVWLTSSTGVLVQGNRFDNCRTGVNTDAFSAVPSGGNRVIGNRAIGGVDGYVLDLQGAHYATSVGDVVALNTITGCSGKGIIVDSAVSGAVVTGNHVRGCTAEGIALLHATLGALVSDNTVQDCQVGLVITNAGTGNSPARNSVTNNRFSKNVGQGVQLYTSYQTSLIGNQINENGAQGVATFASSYAQSVQLLGNTIMGNQLEGVVARDALDWAIIGNNIINNSAAAPGTYPGVRIVQADVIPSRNRVIGNSFKANDAAQTQSSALHYSGAQTSENYFAFNAVGTGYASGAINDGSGGLIAWGNQGADNRMPGTTTLGAAMSVGGGVGVLGVAEAATVPTGNPAGGGVLFVQGGVLKYRGTSGTVTTLGPA